MWRSALALVAACLLSACATERAGVATQTREVGPAGGELEVRGVRVRVPAGALTAIVPMTLTVGAAASKPTPAGFEPFTEVASLTPHGLPFAADVTVLLPARADPGAAARVLRLAEPSASQWTEVAGHTRTGAALAFTTRAFSEYVGGRGGTVCVPRCTGRECGDDGCGGSCGSCGALSSCGGDGRCQSVVIGSCGALDHLEVGAPWPMGRGCANRSGRTAEVGPERPSVSWTFTPSDLGEPRAPAVGADGTLFVNTSSGRLFALSSRNGTVSWTYEAGAGLNGTPALTRGPVLVGDATGTLHAVGRTGARVFTKSVSGADGGASGGVVEDVAVAPDGAYLWATRGGGLHAVTSGGESLFSASLGSEAAAGPTIGNDDVVYVPTVDGALHAFSTSGARRFTHRDSAYAAIVGAVIVEGGNLYFAAATREGSGLLVGLAADRSTSWRAAWLAPVRRALALSALGDAAYASVDSPTAFNSVQSIGLREQTPRWQSATPPGPASEPIVDGAGTIYYGDRTGTLRALEIGRAHV